MRPQIRNALALRLLTLIAVVALLTSCAPTPQRLDIGHRYTITGVNEVFNPRWSNDGLFLTVAGTGMAGGSAGSVYAINIATENTILVAEGTSYRFPTWLSRANSALEATCIRSLSAQIPQTQEINVCESLETDTANELIEYRPANPPVWNRSIVLRGNEQPLVLFDFGTTGEGSFGGFSYRDGKLAFSASADTGSSRVYVLDVANHQDPPKEILGGESIYRSPVWSPDSQWLAFISADRLSGEGHVGIVKPDGTCPQALDGLPTATYQGVDWSPSGDALAIALDDSVYIVTLVDAVGTKYQDLASVCTP